MAKASEADLQMAMDVANVLDDIERGHFPTNLQSDEDAESEQVEWIDTADRQQYERLIFGLQKLLNKGSISRVIWGMAVVCDPSNECIDPGADTIEHHPKRQQLEKQVEGLINKLSDHQRQASIGKAIERACEELPEGFDIRIECEKGAATVRLYDSEGDEDPEDLYTDSGFGAEIDNAINIAVAKGGSECP